MYLRGTKRESRERHVPAVLPFQKSRLPYALRHLAGTDGALFRPWGNVRRDILEACKRAKIAPCSPNDLRRTFSNWMVEAGVPLNHIAQLMGHRCISHTGFGRIQRTPWTRRADRVRGGRRRRGRGKH